MRTCTHAHMHTHVRVRIITQTALPNDMCAQPSGMAWLGPAPVDLSPQQAQTQI